MLSVFQFWHVRENDRSTAHPTRPLADARGAVGSDICSIDIKTTTCKYLRTKCALGGTYVYAGCVREC